MRSPRQASNVSSLLLQQPPSNLDWTPLVSPPSGFKGQGQVPQEALQVVSLRLPQVEHRPRGNKGRKVLAAGQPSSGTPAQLSLRYPRMLPWPQSPFPRVRGLIFQWHPQLTIHSSLKLMGNAFMLSNPTFILPSEPRLFYMPLCHAEPSENKNLMGLVTNSNTKQPSQPQVPSQALP